MPDFRQIVVAGPLGTIQYQFNGMIAIKQVDKIVTTTPLNSSQTAKMLHGTVNSLLANAFHGVCKGFAKVLLIEGLGYKFRLASAEVLTLEIGYSHPVKIAIPVGLKLKIEKDKKLFIHGFDKQKVGLFASQVRKWKRCEPYKGKGIYYQDEVIKRKVGKTASK